MTTPFGTPFPPPPVNPYTGAPHSSTESTLVVEPTLGFDVSHSALNIADGATPNSENFIMRDGRLEPRSVLSRLATDTLSVLSNEVGILTGGTPANTVDDRRYLVVAGQGTNAGVNAWAYLGPGDTSWKDASLVGGFQAQVAGDYWDFAQIYSDVADENMIVGAITSRSSTLFSWVVGSGLVSALTGSPGAKFVAAFNDYLLCANSIDSAGVVSPQRITWADRGSASSWTGGVSGFQDLLGAHGAITRLLPLERRIIVFFEDEIWEGTPVDFPFTFNFAPLDTTIGCPYSWTAAVTPKGIVFMARNYQLYLLPKEGGTAQPIGQPLYRRLRDSIVQPVKAFGAYDGVNDFYHFYYSSGGSANFANRAAFLNFATGSWAPQSFDTTRLVLTRAFTVPLSSSHASTWDDFLNFQPSVTWNDISQSWNDLLGIGNERQTVLALSATTVFEYSATQRVDSLESSNGSSSGVTRNAFWEGRPWGADAPATQKTITRVNVDYVAPSTSSATLRTSGDQGATYSTGFALSLVTASTVSQMPAYVQQPARYPMFRIETSDQTGLELHRFHVTARIGGR